MAAILDLIDTGRYTLTADGAEHVIVGIVSGVTGTAYSRRPAAIRASGVPRIGTPHPSEPTLILQEISVDPRPGHTDSFLLTLRYATPRPGDAPIDKSQRYGPTTWQGATRTVTEETSRDINGRLMVTFYAGFPNIDTINATTQEVTIGAFNSYTRISKVANVEFDTSLLVLRASRWERDDPEPAARDFPNKINRDRWRGYPALSVYRDDVSFSADPDGGYRVDYTFTYNPKGWRIENTVEIANQVPRDATVGNGIQFFSIYEAVSFAALQL